MDRDGCSICLDTEDGKFQALPCGHKFHKQCIERLQRVGNGTTICPNCRNVSEIIPPCVPYDIELGVPDVSARIHPDRGEASGEKTDEVYGCCTHLPMVLWALAASIVTILAAAVTILFAAGVGLLVYMLVISEIRVELCGLFFTEHEVWPYATTVALFYISSLLSYSLALPWGKNKHMNSIIMCGIPFVVITCIFLCINWLLYLPGIATIPLPHECRVGVFAHA